MTSLNWVKIMDMNLTDNTGMTCCFCNEGIKGDNTNPCDINITTNWDNQKNDPKHQTFWCHWQCFQQKMHKDLQQHFLLRLLTED